MKTSPLSVCAVFLAAVLEFCADAGDWPQWRGPQRNGVAEGGVPLLDRVPSEGLKELWESEGVPANDEGGLSSPVSVGDRVYLALVWHRDLPSETRQIGELVLRQIGHQSTKALGPELVKKLEETRSGLSPTLRGSKLDEFSRKWVEENLDAKQKQLYSGFVANRFKKGSLAIPLDVLDALDRNKDTVFPSDAAMRAWLESQGLPERVREEIAAAVPPTRRVAEDMILCLSLRDGKTLWKASAAGAPLGRTASSTPCVVGNRVYALGSTRLWCVDAETGAMLWERPVVQKRAQGTSPLVVDGVVVINSEVLKGFAAENGRELWSQVRAGGGSSSPVAWTAGGQSLVLCNGSGTLDAVDPHTGEGRWTVPGGGDSTPAVSGDWLAVQVRKPQTGLAVFQLKPDGAERVWTHTVDALRTQSSPVVADGVVYLMDDNVHFAFELESGKVLWREGAQSTIASPVLADGKLFAMANNGNTLLVLKAGRESREELGRATVRAQWVPSPCIAGDRLVLRMKDRLKCWSLAP